MPIQTTSGAPTQKVFISYRRNDTRYPADRIYKAFVNVLPKGEVFMDIYSLPLGIDFSDQVRRALEQCDIFLALIGPGWLDAESEDGGGRRLENEDDSVRVEVREALERAGSILVVPVLIDGARMPRESELPADIAELVLKQAVFVEFRNIDTDIARLIASLGLAGPGDGAIVPRDPTVAPSRSFRAFPDAPEMTVIPKGHFIMGSPPDEPGHNPHEGPRHEVVIKQDFAMGICPVTRDQFAAFVTATGYVPRGGCTVWTGSYWELNTRASWRKPGFKQDGSHPVVGLNSRDIEAYIAWLNTRAATVYRLPSEAEWEYACRAGTTSPLWWGKDITTQHANYNDTYGKEDAEGDFRRGTVPARSFRPNPWGLYQMLGNVWERCEDRWNKNSYMEKPRDPTAAGSAVKTGGDPSRCVIRGGSWLSSPDRVRAAYRLDASLITRYSDRGFRIVTTVP